MIMVFCEDCATEITEVNAYQKVEGWSRKRGGGGPNQITVPVRLPFFLCWMCVEKRKRGTTGQEGLF